MYYSRALIGILIGRRIATQSNFSARGQAFGNMAK